MAKNTFCGSVLRHPEFACHTPPLLLVSTPSIKCCDGVVAERPFLPNKHATVGFHRRKKEEGKRNSQEQFGGKQRKEESKIMKGNRMEKRKSINIDM